MMDQLSQFTIFMWLHAVQYTMTNLETMTLSTWMISLLPCQSTKQSMDLDQYSTPQFIVALSWRSLHSIIRGVCRREFTALQNCSKYCHYRRGLPAENLQGLHN